MLFKLLYFTFVSFYKKIKTKMKYSNLQFSALIDILAHFFLAFSKSILLEFKIPFLFLSRFLISLDKALFFWLLSHNFISSDAAFAFFPNSIILLSMFMLKILPNSSPPILCKELAGIIVRSHCDHLIHVMTCNTCISP